MNVIGEHPEWGTIAETEGIAYILTPCCQASAKGSVNSSTGVCCRACYRELPEWTGMAWDAKSPDFAAVRAEITDPPGSTAEVAEIPNCDIHPCDELAVYDSRTIHGPWAYLCERHWQMWGMQRLGTGHGQRLVVRT